MCSMITRVFLLSVYRKPSGGGGGGCGGGGGGGVRCGVVITLVLGRR